MDEKKNLAVKQMTRKEQAILKSQSDGFFTFMVNDETLMRLCALADEWDALCMQTCPEIAKAVVTDRTLEAMLYWFLDMGAEKLQLNIVNVANYLEGQS